MNSTQHTQHSTQTSSAFETKSLSRSKKSNAPEENLNTLGFDALFANALVGSNTKNELLSVQNNVRNTPATMTPNTEKSANPHVQHTSNPPSPLNTVASAVQKSISNQQKNNNPTPPSSAQNQAHNLSTTNSVNDSGADTATPQNNPANSTNTQQTPNQLETPTPLEQTLQQTNLTTQDAQLNNTNLQTKAEFNLASDTSQNNLLSLPSDASRIHLSSNSSTPTNATTLTTSDLTTAPTNHLDTENSDLLHTQNTASQANRSTRSIHLEPNQQLAASIQAAHKNPTMTDSTLAKTLKIEIQTSTQTQAFNPETQSQLDTNNEQNTLDTTTTNHEKSLSNETIFKKQDTIDVRDSIKAKSSPQLNSRNDMALANPTTTQSAPLNGLKVGDQKLATAGVESPKTPNAQILSSVGPGLNPNHASSVQQIKTPVNQPGFVKEISQKLNWAIGKNLSTIDLKLTPDQMGTLNIRLIQKGNTIQLIVRTQDDASATMIQQAISGLKEALGQSGLNLSQVQINTNSQNANQNQNANSNPSNWNQSFQNQQDQSNHKSQSEPQRHAHSEHINSLESEQQALAQDNSTTRRKGNGMNQIDLIA